VEAKGNYRERIEGKKNQSNLSTRGHSSSTWTWMGKGTISLSRFFPKKRKTTTYEKRQKWVSNGVEGKASMRKGRKRKRSYKMAKGKGWTGEKTNTGRASTWGTRGEPS